MFNADHYLRVIRETDPIRSEGRVLQVIGTVIEGTLPDCAVGQLCQIITHRDDPPLRAEVVGFHRDRVLIMPLGEMQGLKPGSLIKSLKSSPTVPVGPELMGRVLSGLGHPIDGGPQPITEADYPIYADPVEPFYRERITRPLDLGVRAMDALLTTGIGQRIGIMSGSGVGKSTVLGMIARNTTADVNVIALVGERGRELKDFIERDLGPEGLARSVVVTSTSDRSPLERVRAAFVATAIAEYFRDQGHNVLLMMDSVTRFAMAQREIGLSIGEPPTSRGYTPSVFALLPKLLERAGMGKTGQGSITGLYTVLVDGDDMTEPVADGVRSILDGHVVLSRNLADRGHYPAIEITASKSRLMNDIVNDEHRLAALELVNIIATYNRAETLIQIGAYAHGSDPAIDRSIRMHDRIEAFLKQDIFENAPMEVSISEMMQLVQESRQASYPGDHEPRTGVSLVDEDNQMTSGGMLNI
jgi:flagellum-specific ATP synthase